MRLLLLLPVLFLVSCVGSLDPIHSSGALANLDFFDNKRTAENMDFSIKALEDMQAENGEGQVIFWRCEGKEYFTAMRKLREGVHQGPNPSRGYYHNQREVVNVTKDTIPWQRILFIRSKA